MIIRSDPKSDLSFLEAFNNDYRRDAASAEKKKKTPPRPGEFIRVS